MNTLVRKIKNPIFLKIELIVGAVIMGAAMIALPICILSIDVTLITNPYVLGVVAIGMLFFGLVGYFGFIRPYILYRKYPEVQAETDGEYLYIHANKEEKIPLSRLTEATVYVHLPFLLQKEFLRWIIIHFLSEEYGDIVLEIPGYGKYKLRFVARVQNTANELTRFFEGAMNNTPW